MKRLTLLCLTLLMAAPALAQDQGMGQMGAPKEMDAVKMLAGDWTVNFKYRGSAEMPWQETQATNMNTLALDGACLVSDFRGSMMGMPMKGMNLLSYNRNTKMWEGVWVDNLNATLSYLEGPMTDGAIVLTGEESMAGQTFSTRITQFNMTADSYDWKMEMSMDGGKTWTEMATAKYMRKTSSSENDGGW